MWLVVLQWEVSNTSCKHNVKCANPTSAGTSRPKKDSEVDGVNYNFMKRKDLEMDIINNRLLEYGEFMGNIYGTSFDAVNKVIMENKICVLDVNPQVSILGRVFLL